MQTFDRANYDVFDAIQLDYQNLTHQIVVKQYTIYKCMVKDSDHLSSILTIDCTSIYRGALCAPL